MGNAAPALDGQTLHADRAPTAGLLPHRAIGTGARYTHEDVRVYLDRVKREGR